MGRPRVLTPEGFTDFEGSTEPSGEPLHQARRHQLHHHHRHQHVQHVEASQDSQQHHPHRHHVTHRLRFLHNGQHHGWYIGPARLVWHYVGKSNRLKRQRYEELQRQGFITEPEGTSLGARLWHYSLVDPYERVNVWSHGLAGLILIAIAIFGTVGYLFPLCAATTHLLSALAHAAPGSIHLEKLDHFGIVLTIAGTPFSVDQAVGWVLPSYTLPGATCLQLVLAAMLPDMARTIGFVTGAVGLIASYGGVVLEVVEGRRELRLWPILAVELALYLSVAVLFLRGRGHVRSKVGLADHHLAHYCVTAACSLHLLWLSVLRREPGTHLPVL